MYSRILVAVDGSDLSQRALREALKLAKGDHPQFRLVHAVDVVPPGGEVYTGLDAYRQSCLDAVRQSSTEPWRWPGRPVCQ